VRPSVPLASIVGVLLAATSVLAQGGVPSLDHYDFAHRTSRFDLPGRLDEISGLAVTPDGRLFAHDDERARVYEIDPRAEKVGKRFTLGDPSIRGDFEAIAVVGERFFILTSHGLLYEFREGGDGAEVPYRLTDTMLGAVCEAEGLDYDPGEDRLLVACKVSAPDRDELVVHRLGLDPGKEPLPSIVIPRDALRARDLDPDFAPSAIAVDPDGTLLLASARTETLIEVDRSGQVLGGVHLSHDRHPQAEGLAFGADGTLYISDEEHGHDARITAYARIPAGTVGP